MNSPIQLYAAMQTLSFILFSLGMGQRTPQSSKSSSIILVTKSLPKKTPSQQLKQAAS